MDAGDVEFSGAVDFNPDEVEDKPTTQSVQNAEQSVETANKVASVKEEDIRFRADDIKNGNDMFVRVAGGDRRKRAAERREKREQKQSLREAEQANRSEKTGASKVVLESEKQLKKEQRRIAKEQREQKRAERRRKIAAWSKKHWYFFVAVAVLVVAGIIVWSIYSRSLEETRKKEAAIAEIVDLDAEVKAIRTRMWNNEDGQQPWTAVKEYDNLIPKLSTDDLKIRAYLSRSRLLIDYVMARTTSDRDEIIRQAKQDVESAEKIDTTDQAVCWGSVLGESIGDEAYHSEYKKKCDDAAIEIPMDQGGQFPDGFEGGRDD
ncbi:hypothetical protein IKX12_01825 [Candidatus Saccharibacteria bacterium]|nr:hypothetical protein [Candidatus Saccharibacteria bacterium]